MQVPTYPHTTASCPNPPVFSGMDTLSAWLAKTFLSPQEENEDELSTVAPTAMATRATEQCCQTTTVPLDRLAFFLAKELVLHFASCTGIFTSTLQQQRHASTDGQNLETET